MSVIVFILVLLAVVMVHEFGHFIFAKRLGMRVDEFAFGFPPRIFGVKKGETEYTVNWLPIGGFVRIFGEDPTQVSKDHPDRSRSFMAKPLWAQAVVIVAGVSMNIVLAWLLLSLTFLIGQRMSVEQELPQGAVLAQEEVVLLVMGESPASEAGLVTGDQLLKIESGIQGEPALFPMSYTTSDALTSAIRELAVVGEEAGIVVRYERGGSEYETTVVPERGLVPDYDGPVIGVSVDRVATVTLPLHLAFLEGASQTIRLTGLVAVGLFSFFQDIFMGAADFTEVAGPVGIVGLVGSAAESGLVALLTLTAIISINLAIINMLPFPALDGGRFIMVLVEGVKGSPIRPRIVSAVNAAGFAFLLALMAVITYNDILRLLPS